MNPSNLQSYALFTNDEFAAVLHYPSEGGEQFVAMTAALKSNPKIVLDTNNSVDKVNKYDVFVEEDYAGYLFIIKDYPGFDLSNLHQALHNDPKVVWIETELPAHPNSKWKLEGTKAVPDEE